MKSKGTPMRTFFLVACLLYAATIPAQGQDILTLPEPDIDGDLMQALKNRATYRELDSREISRQTLAEILWSAYGVNNERTGRRTAATAFNVREMDVYAVAESGSYRYDAEKHSLVPVSLEDNRPILSTQDYVRNAPLHLVYVADHGRARSQYPEWAHPNMERYSHMHAGLIAQNVYLYCAANGLGTVVRDVTEKDTLTIALSLGPDQVIIASQVVAYPAGADTGAESGEQQEYWFDF